MPEATIKFGKAVVPRACLGIDVVRGARRWAPARYALLGLVAAGAIALLAPAGASAALVSARAGHLNAFSGGVQQVNGTLTASGPRYRGDTQTFAAAYAGLGQASAVIGQSSPVSGQASSGSAGASGQASATFNVHWRQGQSVSYGAAFDLPVDFHTATTGQQALLRWDSAQGSGGSFQQGGVVIDYGSNLGYLVVDTVTNGSTTRRLLSRPFSLPIGRWFTLRVRQLLGSGSAAYSEVYVNGRRVVASRAPTFSGKLIDHVRYGIVQLSPDAALGPVSLDFDQAGAAAYTGYVNPLGGDRYIPQRTDMGVDFCLTPGEPVRAVGDGIVMGINPDWFKHQPYIWYQLLDGPYVGRYVYVAEQVARLPRVGTQVTAGQPIGYYKKAGTCIETGWSAADGATLAQATTGYTEGQITRSGVSFARFLISLGVQGRFELIPSPVTPTKHKHHKPALRRPPR